MGIQLSLLGKKSRYQRRFFVLFPLLLTLTAEAKANLSATAWATQAQAIGVPGGAMAQIEHGVVTEVTTFGDAQPESRYLWGSLSKPVAATIVKQLFSRGQLSPSQLVSHYVPGGPEVSVSQLLNHTAGLEFGAQWLDVNRPSTSAFEVAKSLPTKVAGQHTYHYSSLGYLYLQALIERASGKSYEENLRELLSGTQVGASASSCSDVTKPHRLAGPFALPLKGTYDGAGAAYGYTCGSIRDLAAFALDHLQHPQLGNAVPTGHPGQGYAQGWRITQESDGHTTHWHTGTVPGYFSAIYLDPGTKTGVVILMDASGYLHEEQLAMVTRAAFDRVTGRAPQPIPKATAANTLPMALLFIAAVVTSMGLFRCSRTMTALAGWSTATMLLAGAFLLLPTLTGYPLRYFWLWEPGLVIGAVGLELSFFLGLLNSLRLRTAANHRIEKQDSVMSGIGLKNSH